MVRKKIGQSPGKDSKLQSPSSEQSGKIAEPKRRVAALDGGEELNNEALDTIRSSKTTPKKANSRKIKVEDVEISTPRSSRKRKAIKYSEEDASDAETGLTPPALKHESPGRTKVKIEQDKDFKVESAGEVVEKEKVTVAKKVRKSKAEKEAEAMPLANRTVGHLYNIGAHVSAAGGVDKAVNNAVHIGANSFALFLKSQRKWANPPLETATAELWHAQCGHHGFGSNTHVVPHGSYLVNLAHTDPARTEQAYGAFIDDLKRCERLNIKLYNFHPGNVQGVTRPEAIAHLAKNLNRAHKETSTVVTLLENMAAGGNVIGSTFEDLADTIALVEDKSRVGVCLDTCHAFAAGYDLRTKDALEHTLGELDRIVGLKYLRAVHLNDSKAPFDSKRDLHANIGTGFLGLRAFHGIMNEPRFEGMPIVLETPIEVYDDAGNPVKDEKGKDTKEDRGIWAREIKMLESLTGTDIEGAHFKGLEAQLAARGQKERTRVQDQVDRRAEKKAKPAAKKAKRGKGDDSDSESG